MVLPLLIGCSSSRPAVLAKPGNEIKKINLKYGPKRNKRKGKFYVEYVEFLVNFLGYFPFNLPESSCEFCDTCVIMSIWTFELGFFKLKL
jgi:hypothetical protein